MASKRRYTNIIYISSLRLVKPNRFLPSLVTMWLPTTSKHLCLLGSPMPLRSPTKYDVLIILYNFLQKCSSSHSISQIIGYKWWYRQWDISTTSSRWWRGGEWGWKWGWNGWRRRQGGRIRSIYYLRQWWKGNFNPKHRGCLYNIDEGMYISTFVFFCAHLRCHSRFANSP